MDTGWGDGADAHASHPHREKEKRCGATRATIIELLADSCLGTYPPSVSVRVGGTRAEHLPPWAAARRTDVNPQRRGQIRCPADPPTAPR